MRIKMRNLVDDIFGTAVNIATPRCESQAGISYLLSLMVWVYLPAGWGLAS